MKITDNSPPVLTALDRPNSYIGRSVPRPNLQRLTQGRGLYVSDVTLPRMAHVAYVRSPHAHARIVNIVTEAAKKAPGVIAAVIGAELAKVMTPWVGVLTHLKGLKSAPQAPLAVERACWQGEAVCAVVARTRAEAEDACELVEVRYEELPAVTDPEIALDAKTPVIHASLGDNLCFERKLDVGAVDKAFAESDAVVEATFRFGRHTGVTTEPRAVVADWNEGEQRMTVYHGTQAPHMMQNLFAKHLGIAEHQVRVLTKDVGGSFGIKVHTYADEMATVALSKLLKRPVKFVADRIESFVTDIHARDHRIKAKIGVSKDGTITAFEIDDLTGIGPYSVYPRTSGIEANQIVNLVGGPYNCPNYRAQARVVFQNKNVMCQYRAVGHPIAVAVTEGLVDLAAAKIGMDPLELRRRNLIPDDAYPTQSASGLKFELLSHHEALAHLEFDDELRGTACRAAKVARKRRLSRNWVCEFHRGNQPLGRILRRRGGAYHSDGWRHGETRRTRCDHRTHRRYRTRSGRRSRGRSMCSVVVRRTSRKSARHHRRYRQYTLWRWHLGLAGCRHRRRSGVAGRQALRANVLAVAASILQAKPDDLDIRNGLVVDKDKGTERLPLDELARIAYFRPDTLPPGFQAERMATRHYVPRAWPFAFTNGIQGSYLEVDIETGFVKLLKHWCVEDCGTIINPQLVDEQIRGGVMQGIGAALFEHCLYDERGQLLNGNMADYLVPMAVEMPDIECGHVVSPTADSELGAKGAGEAGTAGAPGSVMNAINDALRPLGAQPLTDMPFTPDKILRALGKV